MTTPSATSRILSALVSGIGTAAYYATPDVISSRTARAWAKTGIGVMITAASIPELLAMREDLAEKKAAGQPERDAAADAASAGTDSSSAESADESIQGFADLSTRAKVAMGGAFGAVLAVSCIPVVLAEKWAFRHGEARAAAGKPLAHTRPALVYGLLAAALTLVPMDRDSE